MWRSPPTEPLSTDCNNFECRAVLSFRYSLVITLIFIIHNGTDLGFCGSYCSFCSFRMSKEGSQLPSEPISAVGVVTSFSKGPDGYYVVSKTVQLLNWWRIKQSLRHAAILGYTSFFCVCLFLMKCWSIVKLYYGKSINLLCVCTEVITYTTIKIGWHWTHNPFAVSMSPVITELISVLIKSHHIQVYLVCLCWFQFKWTFRLTA